MYILGESFGAVLALALGPKCKYALMSQHCICNICKLKSCCGFISVGDSQVSHGTDG